MFFLLSFMKKVNNEARNIKKITQFWIINCDQFQSTELKIFVFLRPWGSDGKASTKISTRFQSFEYDQYDNIVQGSLKWQVITLGMWYLSGAETNSHRVRPSMDTSTYLYRHVGYGIPSQTTRAQDVQRTFITPEHHWHVN